MTRFIGMEYLASAAFISTDKNAMRLSEIADFRMKVVDELEERDIDDAVLMFSNVDAMRLARNYSDCFYLTDDDEVLHLKVTRQKLISTFMAYLALDVLDAFEKPMGEGWLDR